MNHVRRTCSLAIFCVWAASCRNAGPESSASTASSAASAPPSASAPPAMASAAPSASTAKITLTSPYEARLGEVRIPGDAPPFVHPTGETRGLGKGTLTIDLPATDGPVTGRAEGALGEQTFSGMIESGVLSGSLSPVDSTSPGAMWGVVYGPVQGDGAGRHVDATLRASSADGRIVREAEVHLAKAQ